MLIGVDYSQVGLKVIIYWNFLLAKKPMNGYFKHAFLGGSIF